MVNDLDQSSSADTTQLPNRVMRGMELVRNRISCECKSPVLVDRAVHISASAHRRYHISQGLGSPSWLLRATCVALCVLTAPIRGPDLVLVRDRVWFCLPASKAEAQPDEGWFIRHCAPQPILGGLQLILSLERNRSNMHADGISWRCYTACLPQ